MMGYGWLEYVEVARMRQERLLQEAQHDRLVRSLRQGQPGLLARLRRMAQRAWSSGAAQRVGTDQEASVAGASLASANGEF